MRNGFFKVEDRKSTILNEYDFETINLLSISLMVSNSCNLRCIYCFNDGGTIPEDSEIKMSLDVAKASIDYLIKNSGENVGCDFFGGEPLINFDLIRMIVDYCKTKDKKNWQFSMITNGTIINDEIIKLFKENNFHIVVSYDSILQDIQRVSSTGKSNKKLIRGNIKKLQEAIPRSELSIRSILTHNMIPHILAIIDEAKELGVRVLFGPITLSQGNEMNLNENDYNVYIDTISKVLEESWNSEKIDQVTGITSIANIVLQLMTGNQRYYSCGLGTDQVGVSSSGKIYPCHRFIGLKGLCMGDIFNGIDKEKYKSFVLRFVDNLTPCSECWAKYFCGGGCAHESYTYNNNLFVPFNERCELTKKEIELGLSLYAETLSTGNENKLLKISNMATRNID